MANRTGTAKIASVGTAMLEQLADLDARAMSAEIARRLLLISFKPSHKRRVKLLSEKARNGALSPEEGAELDEFIRVADLLAILHSKARQALKRSGIPA